MKRVFCLLQIFLFVFVTSCSKKNNETPIIKGRISNSNPIIKLEEVELSSEQNPEVLEEASQFILEKSNELYTRSPVVKSISCPVMSLKHADILNKINLIKSSVGKKCSSNAELLNNFMSAAAGLSLMSGGGEIGFGNLSFTKALSENIDLSGLLIGLSYLTNKKECIDELAEKGGALNAIAELALQVSQLGLLFPRNEGGGYGTVGAVLSTGGLIFGVLTTLISQVLTGHYDWKLEKDRTAFMNLNCAYFELRKQIQDSGLQQHNEDYSQEKIGLYSDALSKIEHFSTKLEKERDVIFKSFDKKKEAYIGSQLSHEKQELYHSLNKLQQVLKPQEVVTKNEKRKLLYEFAKSSPEIQNSLRQYAQNAQKTSRSANLDFMAKINRISSYSSDEIIATQKQTDLEKIENYYSTDGEDFLDLKSSFATHTQRILDDIAGDYLASENEWKSIKLANGTNGDMYDSLKEEYAIAKEDLTNLKNYYKSQIVILESFLNKENYVFHDDGDLNSFNIRLLQDQINSILYGREARRFLKFITNNTKERLNDFLSYLNSTQIRLEEKFLDREKSARKINSCNAAVKLEDTYLLAQEAAEVGSDFIFTNLHIFYPPSDTRKKFLIFKFGENHQSAIYRHVQTVLFVNKDRYGVGFKNNELKDAKAFMGQKDTLGFQINRIKSYEDQMIKINKFIQNNQCRDLLKVMAN